MNRKKNKKAAADAAAAKNAEIDGSVSKIKMIMGGNEKDFDSDDSINFLWQKNEDSWLEDWGLIITFDILVDSLFGENELQLHNELYTYILFYKFHLIQTLITLINILY